MPAPAAQAFDHAIGTGVTRSALKNAASLAGLILTTDALVAELPEGKAAGGMM